MSPRDFTPLFMSERHDWETPPELLAALSPAFTFDLDVCALRANVSAVAFFSPSNDGLRQPWHGTCWCNPPYSEVGTWVEKAYQESLTNVRVLCLTFARTDTSWWQRYAPHASVITFLRGRLRFVGIKHREAESSLLSLFGRTSTAGDTVRVVGSGDSAPAPSALLLFGVPTPAQIRVMAKLGWTVIQHRVD